MLHSETRKLLLKALEKGTKVTKENDVPIMDNMRSHHAKAVQAVLAASGVKVLFLPPYSPDLNPIEGLWSKMKAILRRDKVRLAENLPSVVSSAFSNISLAVDCVSSILWGFSARDCKEILDRFVEERWRKIKKTVGRC